MVAGSGVGVPESEMVRMEVPEPPKIEFVEKPVVNLAGALTNNVTLPVNPLSGEIVIVVDDDWPGGLTRHEGLVATWKSWTVAITGTENDIAPEPVAVTVTVYVPAGVEAELEM
jgi:hypothetical protein